MAAMDRVYRREVRASSVSFSATESRDQVMSEFVLCRAVGADGYLGDGVALGIIFEGRVTWDASRCASMPLP